MSSPKGETFREECEPTLPQGSPKGDMSGAKEATRGGFFLTAAQRPRRIFLVGWYSPGFRRGFVEKIGRRGGAKGEML
jgi:hypothetical protein